MKVCLYNVTSTTQFGGVETFVWELASRLPAANVQVDLFGGNGTVMCEVPPDVKVYRFPYLARRRLSRIPLLNRSATLIKFLERSSFGLSALPKLLRERYDILHIQKPYDLPVGVCVRLLAGTKLLFGCHGTDFYAGDKFFTRFVDGAVSCSRFNARQIWEHYRLAPVIVYNGFDPSLFHPKARDEGLRLRFAQPSEALLLYAGRLIRWKGIHHLLDALALLGENVKLLIVGEGEERARLEQQALNLGLDRRVFFVGQVRHPDLAQYYVASDLVVLPSLTHETFSIVACEALACERPVLGTNVGGIPELVEELVPPADAAALAEKIRALLADPARCAEIAHRGHEKVFAFLTWGATTARVVEVYEELKRGERAFAAPHVASGERDGAKAAP